jgi:hypothetical protein
MKAFLGGIAAMIVIAVAAAFVLNNTEYLLGDRATSERGSVRLGDAP